MIRQLFALYHLFVPPLIYFRSRIDKYGPNQGAILLRNLFLLFHPTAITYFVIQLSISGIKLRQNVRNQTLQLTHYPQLYLSIFKPYFKQISSDRPLGYYLLNIFEQQYIADKTSTTYSFMDLNFTSFLSMVLITTGKPISHVVSFLTALTTKSVMSS